MTTTIVQYQVHHGRERENEALVREVLAELAVRQPPGLHYQVYRQADGSFVHVVDVEEGSDPAGLTSLASFQRFAERIGDRVVTDPHQQAAARIGHYEGSRGSTG